MYLHKGGLKQKVTVLKLPELAPSCTIMYHVYMRLHEHKESAMLPEHSSAL